MTPARSSNFTRRRQVDSDSPTRSAKSALAMLPSACSTARILRSTASSCIICFPAEPIWQFLPYICLLMLHIAILCQRRPAEWSPDSTLPTEYIMRIGVPSEIKVHEYRVGLMPAAVRELTLGGHTVMVQSKAGQGVGCSDEDYFAAGARIVADAATVFAGSDLIVKVKEPQLAECEMLRAGQVLFTYLHLAADPAQAKGL